MKIQEIPALLLILIVAALLRFPLVAQGFFAFTYDQGRDLLKVREIVENLNLTLIGPTTGLPGIFYGPWWYYFLSPLMIFSQGNVQTIALIFATIGMVSILLLFFLIKKISKNTTVALILAATAAMSGPFIASSSQIWSPSLVLPLMMLYITSLYQILEKSKSLWFFTLGLSCAAIADSGAAFGIMLTIATIVTAILFKRNFFKKDLVFFFLGIFLVLLPRIIFEIKNDFLMTREVINWIFSPAVFQEKLTLMERAITRLDLFFLNFAQTFSQSNKFTAVIPLLVIAIFLLILKRQIFKNQLFKFLTVVLLILYVCFTLFPDAVWDYYLVGLPIIYITLMALVLSHTPGKFKFLLPGIAMILLALNFRGKLLSPFSITWLGDGAIYRNQIKVLEDIKGELSGNYTLYVYSPAGIDYPFNYLLTYKNNRNQIDLPSDNQKTMFLIIRDDQSHSFMPTGWYGDKTRDHTKLISKKDYPGNIIVEKHIRND